MIECCACGQPFDEIGRRYLCPCGVKNSCCEGAPLPPRPVMKPDRCFIYTGEADLAVAVADGRVSEHDALAVRRFAEFLRQAPPLPPRNSTEVTDES